MKLKRIILTMLLMVLAVASVPSTTLAVDCPDEWCFVETVYYTVDWGTDYTWLDDSGCYGGEKEQAEFYRDYRLVEEYALYENKYTGAQREDYKGTKKIYYGEWTRTGEERYVPCSGY